jgi:hypothetical protein
MVPDGWSCSKVQQVLEDPRVSEPFKQLLKKHKLDTISEEALYELWAQFMEGVFVEAAATWSKPAPSQSTVQMSIESTVPKPKFRLLGLKDKLDALELLGSHPQGYYRTYVTKKDQERMIEAGYKLGSALPFPKQSVLIAAKLNGIVKGTVLQTTKDQKDTKTQTSISKTTIRIAGNWPRIQTQNAVMGNISANKVSFLPEPR